VFVRVLSSNAFVRSALVLLLLVTFLFARGDRMGLSAAAAASTRHEYGLISWELFNFLDKWAYRVNLAAPWTSDGETHRREKLDRYLELAVHLRDAQGSLDRVSATSAAQSEAIVAAQRDVDRLVAERNSLRNIVEEYLESEVSRTLSEYGFGGSFLWPPVDFRLDNPPSVLVVSPRNVIERRETVLVDPETSVTEMENLEARLLLEEDVSAVVLRTGGLASYPTVISSNRDLLGLLEVASHEWMHAYLFFHPLGRSFFSGGEMVTFNETLADMFGREVGRVTYNRITGEHVEPVVAPTRPRDGEPGDQGVFEFNRFMHDTRVRADELLEHGEIESAEAYMEERRATLAEEHGIFIRKLNQAYFAFTGSYGESGGSVSPLPFQLWEVREKSGGLTGLVRAVEGITSIREFEALLTEFEISIEAWESGFG